MNYVDFAGFAAMILAAVALYKAWKSAPGVSADAARTWQEMAGCAARDQKKMREDISKLEDKLDALEETLEEYIDGVDKLIRQLEKHDIEPVWQPKRRRVGVDQ